VIDSLGCVHVAVLAKVDSALPKSSTPVIGGNLDRGFAISSNLPEAGGHESIDMIIVSHSAFDIGPVLLGDLLVLACLQIDLADVVMSQGIAHAADLDHHLGFSPGRVLLLSVLPAIFS